MKAIKEGVRHIKISSMTNLLNSCERDVTNTRVHHTHCIAQAGPLSNQIHRFLAAAFSMSRDPVVVDRVNVFAPSQGKAQHQDRNAFNHTAGNLTCSLSVGSPRTFRFTSLNDSSQYVDLCLEDGHILAFNAEVNRLCVHEVLPADGKRLSFVIWGFAEMSSLCLQGEM